MSNKKTARSVRAPLRLSIVLAAICVHWAAFAWSAEPVSRKGKTSLLANSEATSGESAAGPHSVFPVQETGVMDWAKRIDAALANEHPGDGKRIKNDREDDALFLRRVYLDVVGALPPVEQTTRFLNDRNPNKRVELIDQLLADPRFGERWGRYWRDVIYYRRSDPRALLAAPATASFVADAFNKDRPWNEVAQEFIKAEGDVTQVGATAIFAAQQGQAAESAAEVSRIFLGIQIQCAQCHDHPTDRWKREQFHELAAFFPRVSFRRQRDEKRTFVVQGNDMPRLAKKKADMPGRGDLEHRIPDLDDPSKPGPVVKPAFFVTGQTLPLGSSDATRRGELAQWLTDAKNPWFAKSFINRTWSELVGWGFYPSVDDLGPDRECAAPKTLDALVQGFLERKHSVKALFRAIMLSDAYQHPAAWAHVPQKNPNAGVDSSLLTADQIFDSLAVVLESPLMSRTGRRGPVAKMLAAGGPRIKYQQVFGYDPSLPANEVAMSVPQALTLMNAPELQKKLRSDARFSILGQISAVANDADAVSSLYLRILCREPNGAELKTAQSHLRDSADRGAALEDLAWVLLNSTEFVHRP